MDEVRLGVIGLRNIGKGHIRHGMNVPGARFTAIADNDPARLRAAAEEFGIGRCYADAAELLASDEVDAVVLALPNHLHAPVAIQALIAGKHVLVEKPIARSVAEADTMIAARDQSGCTLMVGMNQRFEPRHQAAKARIDAGTLGRIQYGRTRWTMCRPFEGLWERGDWFLTRQHSGGGPLIDLGVHRLDLALHLMGFPRVQSVLGAVTTGIGQRVAAERGKQYELEDAGLGFIRFTDGRTLHLEASYFLNDRQSHQDTVLYGDRGTLLLGPECAIFTGAEENAEPVPMEPPVGVATSCVEHFVRVLLGEEELSPTAEQARVSMEIIEAIYRNAETGQPMVFAPVA